MDQSPQWRSLILAVAIFAAFVGAVSMNIGRLQGWSFLVLCAIAGSLGGVGYLWARDRVLPTWERLPGAKRFFLIALIAVVVLAGRLVANRHKPEREFADVMVGVCFLIALALLELYRVRSHRP